MLEQAMRVAAPKACLFLDAGTTRVSTRPTTCTCRSSPRRRHSPSRSLAALGRCSGWCRAGTCYRLAGPLSRRSHGRHRLGCDRPLRPLRVGDWRAFPHAPITVDKWHLLKLANDVVTQVR